jgi:hypothetical protein
MNKGKHLKKFFIDKLRIYVKSGDGGNGLPKFGGIGGDGILFRYFYFNFLNKKLC